MNQMICILVDVFNAIFARDPSAARTLHRLDQLNSHPNAGTYTHTHMHAHTLARMHARMRAHIHTNAWPKLRPDTDDEQQLKGHNYTVLHTHKSAAEIIEIAVPR